MRSLIVTQNITLDGVIDLTHDDWFAPPSAEEAGERHDDLIEVQRQHQAAADALLVGRNTFEAFRGFWPHQHDDVTGVSDYLNRVHKYVVSSTLTDPGWERSTVLRGPVLEEVGALKAAPGADIVITGSMRLVDALNGSGLIDEYRLFVYPVVVGRGHRLFENATGIGSLRLAEVKQFKSGIAFMRYLSS
jgi:dihydrofolate reductase